MTVGYGERGPRLRPRVFIGQGVRELNIAMVLENLFRCVEPGSIEQSEPGLRIGPTVADQIRIRGKRVVLNLDISPERRLSRRTVLVGEHEHCVKRRRKA